MRKKIALLALLLIASVGMAYIVSASDDLKALCVIFFGENEVRVINSTALLSEDRREKAVEIALNDPQVKEILQGVNEYIIGASAIFDVQEIEDPERGKGIALILKEGFAMVSIRIFGEEHYQKTALNGYDVIVDLSQESVSEIREFPRWCMDKWGWGTKG